ncbi:hypothetical protein TrRE_jg13510 [Triparma retinervis]|uniref:Uncharacterized protein n=1 Tax=Triparma retinervis TaxID=2557542 RepID=A0A9W7DQK9_9STRA|nr:hypothetical protein TrRE_jg13510 [Triparma retinervis]
MSSLSSQLNALSNQGTSSKSHTNTHGRGFGYTANAGYHTQATTEDSAKFKATIIYDDPKAAAAISKGVLREK